LLPAPKRRKSFGCQSFEAPLVEMSKRIPVVLPIGPSVKTVQKPAAAPQFVPTTAAIVRPPLDTLTEAFVSLSSLPSNAIAGWVPMPTGRSVGLFAPVLCVTSSALPERSAHEDTALDDCVTPRRASNHTLRPVMLRGSRCTPSRATAVHFDVPSLSSVTNPPDFQIASAVRLVSMPGMTMVSEPARAIFRRPALVPAPPDSSTMVTRWPAVVAAGSVTV
jgi:hypothetical protein